LSKNDYECRDRVDSEQKTGCLAGVPGARSYIMFVTSIFLWNGSFFSIPHTGLFQESHAGLMRTSIRIPLVITQLHSTVYSTQSNFLIRNSQVAMKVSNQQKIPCITSIPRSQLLNILYQLVDNIILDSSTLMIPRNIHRP
jgi:hypothetical protein